MDGQGIGKIVQGIFIPTVAQERPKKEGLICNGKEANISLSQTTFVKEIVTRK